MPRWFDRLELWEHQRRAADMMGRYLTQYAHSDSKGSALVHMPTGSGKTRVISALSLYLPRRYKIGSVLIMAPRRELRDQLHRELKKPILRDPKSAGKNFGASVINMKIGWDKLGNTIEGKDNLVFVSTIQKIRSMSAKKKSTFKTFKEKISLVLIDEGHYEPATFWSATIRKFQCPSILFTATPYRNDLKEFDFMNEFIFSYTFHEALEQQYLRRVEFIPRQSTDDANKFVDDVVNFYQQKTGGQQAILGNENSKLFIIRCSSESSINTISSRLKQKRYSSIAVHEKFDQNKNLNFDPDNPKVYRYKSVPYVADNCPIFWIHQYKLLEGIDNTRFQFLALFDQLKTSRPLIQQIGRIIRNPNKEENAVAYVLDHSLSGEHLEMWNAFLSNEMLILRKKELVVAPPFLTYFRNAIGSIPDSVYIEGAHRTRFNEKDFDPMRHLQLPLATNILETTNKFNIDEFKEILRHRLKDEDRVFFFYDIEDRNDLFVVIYFAIKNSPFLRFTYFLESDLNVIVCKEHNEHIAFYDSAGYVPINDEELHIGSAVSPDRLICMFQDRPLSKISMVSLKNTVLGINTIRSSSFSAESIQDTVPHLDDCFQVLNTASGISTEDYDILQPGTSVLGTLDNTSKQTMIRRYVGIKRGRIRDLYDYFPFHVYINWLDRILSKVARPPRRKLPVFERYAKLAPSVTSPEPKNILIELEKIHGKFVASGVKGSKQGEELTIADSCVEVIKTSKKDKKSKYYFELNANNVKRQVYIEYNPQNSKYKLSSEDLDELYTRKPGESKNLVGLLNSEQAFRVIPEQKNIVYVNGKFYRTKYEFGPGFNLSECPIGKMMIPLDILSSICTEKGEKYKNDLEWRKNSLFGLIYTIAEGSYHGHCSERLVTELSQPDIMVNDDMQTEIADFIFVNDKEKKVVFIHAKASSEPHPYSASILAIIISQAIKNLHYLSMFNDQIPPGLQRWNNHWSPPGNKSIIKPRLLFKRGKSLDPDNTWKEISSRISNPLWNREICLLLGNIACKETLEELLRNDPPTPEAVQAAMLLQSSLASIGSIDAKLKVLCY